VSERPANLAPLGLSGRGAGPKIWTAPFPGRGGAAGKVPFVTFEDLNIAQGEDFAPLAQSQELGPDRP
jgi:hypothetical protein